ncbi:MAG TPA: hypothetical protein VGJ73_19760 [Verrucomicrobiae bacterium]|jgi:hypothetical protein
MSFFNRRYKTFVILGDPAAEPAWTEQRWKLITDVLDPLMEKARDRPAVRSTQLREGPGSPNQRAISFGRIGWNPQGHKKWVHSASANNRNEFILAEVWAPARTVCVREHQAPDVYVTVRNNQCVPGDHVTFNPIFILAVALDADPGIVATAQASADALSKILGSVLRVRCDRPWGFRAGLIFRVYHDVIGHLHTVGLFKPGPLNERPPSLEIFEARWEVF